MNAPASNLTRAAAASIVVHALALSGLAYLNFTSLPQLDIAPGASSASRVSLIEHDTTYFKESSPVDAALEEPADSYSAMIEAQHALLQPLQHAELNVLVNLVQARVFTRLTRQQAAHTIPTIQVPATSVAEHETDAPITGDSPTAPPSSAPQALTAAAQADSPRIPVNVPVTSATVAVETVTTSTSADSGFALSPTPLSQNKPPRYPLQALRDHLAGTVLLRLIIEPDGTVSEVSILDSSGFEILDTSAIEAARRWRFQPAQENGTPIRADITAPVNFILK
ncbi:MAG TPA: energy transducer TonB [Phycisphaerales bacterium]|nr:energy transducer TonB [Phycisphaerales bacterium]